MTKMLGEKLYAKLQNVHVHYAFLWQSNQRGYDDIHYFSQNSIISRYLGI
jgi:hypothetical protein